MPLNDARHPRVALLANGLPVLGVIEVEISSNNHFGADRFRAQVSLDATPGSTTFWTSTTDILIDVRLSSEGNSFTSLLQGAVDTVDVDPIRGVLDIEGRDLTARFIETRTQETFVNQTSSEIARTLAERHGLEAVVDDTTTPVGRYYQNEHDRITLDQFSRSTTEWDLLVFLARQEGFDVFASGTKLFFQQPATSAEVFPISPSDVIELHLERALTLARDVEVTVKSWNARQRNAFTQTAKASLGKTSSGRTQRYVLVRPNLTLDQALQLAQQTLAEVTRHERIVAIVMPGELKISPRSLIALSGTGSGFDATYFVDSIDRQLHVGHGFTQHLRCKNVYPGSQATPPGDIVASVVTP